MRVYFFCCFCLLSFSLFAQEEAILLPAKATPLTEVLATLENEHAFFFSFREADVKDQIVHPPAEPLSIDALLTALLKPTGLQFELLPDNFVVLSRGEAKPVEQPRFLLTGKVVDSLTQDPLAYANVYLKKTGTGASTDEQGRFKFQTPLEAGDSLILRYVGYQEKRFSAADFSNGKSRTVQLSYLDFGENFVLVTDYLTDGISLRAQGQATVLQPNKIGPLPGQAEPDVLSAIQFLPGITSSDGTASNIQIRGGTADQNLILWEDIPIYHAAHYFGMISAFNPYIIDKVSVYRGGFDAEYGGRIAGVIDLKSAEPKNRNSDFGAGANFINGYTYGKASLLNNQASVVYSLRHSINGLWRSPTFEHVSRRIHQGVLLDIPIKENIPKSITITDDFTFFDSNVKVTAALSNKDQVSAAWFYNRNNFEARIRDNNVQREQSDSLYLESSGTSLSWTHEWKPGSRTRLLGLSTDYQYNYKYEVKRDKNPVGNKKGNKRSQITERQIHLLHEVAKPSGNHFKFGYQLVDYVVDYRIAKTTGQNEGTNLNENTQSNLQVAYGDFTSSTSKKIGVDLGLRGSYFQKENQAYLEPRARLWYQLSEDLHLNLDFGRYYQFLSQLVQFEGDQASIETPVWVLGGDKEVPVLRSDQIQLGGIYHKKSWLIDLQLYSRKVTGLTSLATGFDEMLSGKFHLGTARINGLDVLIKKRWRKYRSWISYSFSQNTHEFSTFFDNSFRAPNDQPHRLHWVHLWNFGSLQCSLGWKIKSGNPHANKNFYDLRKEGDAMSNYVIVPRIREFNSERLPAQHQLDASVWYHFYPGKKDPCKVVMGLSIFNLYNQENFYQRSLFIEPGQNAPSSLKYSNKSDLGITPNFVLRVEW